MSRKNVKSVKGRNSGKFAKRSVFEPVDGEAILYSIYEDALERAVVGERGWE